MMNLKKCPTTKKITRHINKTKTETKYIDNLYRYLIRAREDKIIVRTTNVKYGVCNGNKLNAMTAGFNISVFNDPEYEARHEFSECFLLTRRSNVD